MLLVCLDWFHSPLFRFVATSLTVLARHMQGKHGPPREEKKKKLFAASAPVHTSVEEVCELLSDCESAPPPSSPLPREVMKSPDKDDLDPGDLTPQGAASSVVDISGTLGGGGSMFDIVDEILEETTCADSVPASSSNSVPAITSNSVPASSSNSVPAISSDTVPATNSKSVPGSSSESVPCSSSDTVPANSSVSVVPPNGSNSVPAISSESVPCSSSDSVPANRTAQVDSPGSIPSRFKRQFHENKSASSA